MMEQHLNGNLHSKENVGENKKTIYLQKMLKKQHNSDTQNEKGSMQKPGFTSLWRDFASQTTAHGFSQLLTSSKGYKKCFWIVSIIGCQVLLYLQIYPLVVRYLQKPTRTKVFLQEESHQIFPMITICNTNAFKRNQIELIKEQKLYKEVNVSEFGFKRRKRRSAHTNVTEDDNAWMSSYNMFSSLGNIAQFEGEEVFKFGHQLNDMLFSCEWIYFTDCSDSKWWRRIWSWKYGNCYTFNMEEKGTSLVNVTGTGPAHGLKMMLKLNQKDYSNSLFEESAGIVLHIAEQGSQINLYKDGYHLAPNFNYLIGLKKTVFRKADPFKNESCIPHKPIDLGPRNVNNQYISKYSTQLCSDVCEARISIENCGCSPYYLPSLKANHTCDATKSKCADDMYEQVLARKFPCIQKCRLPCEATKFEMETSFSKFNPKPSPRYDKDDILRVEIFLKTLETQVMKDAEFYFLENLLGDIGGQLGLFSGVSALTVIEILFLMANLLLFTKIYLQWVLGCKNNQINDANN